MPIKTIEEKNAHPILSQIPDHMWKNLFEQGLDDKKIPDTNKNLNDIRRNDLPDDEVQACIVLMLRFKDVPTASFCNYLENTLEIDNQKLFTNSVIFNRLDILTWVKKTAPDKLPTLIEAGNYQAFRDAGENGHLDILKWLKDAASDQFQKMKRAISDSTFNAASVNGHLHILEWFKEEDPHSVPGLIEGGRHFYAFRQASKNGHLDILKWFQKEAIHNQFSEMIRANHSEAFQFASTEGHLDILKWYKEMGEMKESDIIFAFRDACENGHLDILKWIKEEYPALQEFSNASNFQVACTHGHLDILKWFKKEDPDKFLAMLEADDYFAFSNASASGHLDILKWLKVEAKDQFSEMIKSNNYDAFRVASKNGHLDILKWLKDAAPDQFPAMIELFDHNSFLRASEKGRLDILKWFKEEAPDKFIAMLEKDDYVAFGSASKNGHLDILKWFKEEAPNQFTAMIEADNYDAFVQASKYGHLDVLKWLKEEAKDQFTATIEANIDNYFYWAGNRDVFKWLLEEGGNVCLAQIESHYQEQDYSEIIDSFINEKLTQLHQEKEAALLASPNAIFDINDAEKAQQCFYIMRNLIRQDDPDLNQKLRFLLEIPAVKSLAHQADNTGENALFRLALSVENSEAAAILFNIGAVRSLAEQNNFYEDEMRGNIDLAQLAADRESSMTALTPGEVKRLNAAIDLYQPILKQAGISHIMDDLRATLEERYEANPATINVNGQPIKLPLEYQDFQALNLQNDDLQNALTAYYQHADHTALRYLSKPNSWMHKEASYVNINDDHSERWSTFDEYQDLISMLYTAAIDKETEAIDGHTFDSRLDIFIKELALLGRAHNWDNTRVRNGKEEEYDDLDADKPSCFSGVKKRLFQSVQGHPLFSVLTQDIVRKELFKHIQEHFKEVFKEEHRQDLSVALACVIEGDNIPEDVFKRLSSLNLTSEKIDATITKMHEDFTNKYGDAIYEHVDFIKKQFELPQDNSKEDKRMTHLMKFYTSANLERVLRKTSESKPSAAGFFHHPRTGVATSKEEKVDETPKPPHPPS